MTQASKILRLKEREYEVLILLWNGINQFFSYLDECSLGEGKLQVTRRMRYRSEAVGCLIKRRKDSAKWHGKTMLNTFYIIQSSSILSQFQCVKRLCTVSGMAIHVR